MSVGRYPLGGRAVLVTGAASGIGAATARRLARRGARVALIDLDGEGVERVAADCPSAVARVADVADDAALRAAVAACVGDLGGLDVCVANAGVALPGGVGRRDPEAVLRVLEVGLTGAWRTLHAALPHVRARHGYLLGVGSVAALAHLPGLGAYSAAKAGLEALCDALRAEERRRGVGVGYAYLAWVRTGMLGAAGAAGRMPVPPPFHRVASAEAAAAALVDGIEHRRERIFHPRWLRAVLPARGLLQPLVERNGRQGAQ